jgi:hypothetical protein
MVFEYLLILAEALTSHSAKGVDNLFKSGHVAIWGAVKNPNGILLSHSS